MSSRDLTLTSYLDRLATPSALFGGGSAAGYAAAMGWALNAMVAGLAQKHSRERSMDDLVERALNTTTMLKELSASDVQAYAGILRHPSEKTYDEATRIPLAILHHARQGILFLQQTLLDTVQQATPDRMTAQYLFSAAIQSVLVIIEANLEGTSPSMTARARDLISIPNPALRQLG